MALAKALTKFAKDVPSVTFKGAMLNGQIVPADEIQTIANLPSREELVAKLLYLMQSPIRGLATVLHGQHPQPRRRHRPDREAEGRQQTKRAPSRGKR